MKKETLGMVFFATLAYFFVELAGGLYFNSLALVTDASFMAVNLSGQALALYTKKLGERPPDTRNTFGYERAKVLSGLFSGIGVGFVLFYVFIDAYSRIRNPEPLDADYVFIIAVIGLLVNLFGVVMLRHSKEMNIRGAFLLLLNDMLGSVGVIAAAVIIRFTGLYIIDAIASVVMGLCIVYPTYSLIRGSINILMEGIPVGIDVQEVEEFIRRSLEHATQIKGLRVWALVPEKVLLAVKIRTNGNVCHRNTIRDLKCMLKEQFGFYDVYIELYEGEGVKEGFFGKGAVL